MVKTSSSNAGDASSIPGQGAKITHALWPKKKKKKKKKHRTNIVTNPIKFFFNYCKKSYSLIS